MKLNLEIEGSQIATNDQGLRVVLVAFKPVAMDVKVFQELLTQSETMTVEAEFFLKSETINRK